MKKLDNLHYNFRNVDSYNKPFNFIFGARELGKTTAFRTRFFKKWRKDKRPCIYLVRKSVEITEALITSIFDTIINKFIDEGATPTYNKGTFKEGIVDVKVNNEICFRIVSLNIDLRRIKLAVLKNVSCVFMDEYIINPKVNEKYIKNEAFIIKEAYTTWRRESKGILKCYFTANPYSLFNPLFVDWGVDLRKLKRGDFYVGENFVIERAILNPILKEELLKSNPLFKEEGYSIYALEGAPINDANIKLGTLPMNFSLKYVFRFNNKYLGIFRNNNYLIENDKFFIKELDTISKYRTAICFDFFELIEGASLLSREDKLNLSIFKSSLMQRKVAFEDINCYYLIEEIYKYI